MNNAWFCVMTFENWLTCKEHLLMATEGNDAKSRTYGIEQIKKTSIGDKLIFYGLKKGVVGYCEVASSVFMDHAEIWERGVFPHRIKIKLIQVVTVDCAIPFSNIKNKISNMRSGKLISDGASLLGKPMIPLSSEDAHYLIELIEKGKAKKSGLTVSHGNVPSQKPNKNGQKSKPILETNPVSIIKPFWLNLLIERIELLKNQSNHPERNHEALVEDFFKLLGYVPTAEIQYQIGRIDVLIDTGGLRVVIEVKKDWYLSRKGKDVVSQAYGYANQNGAAMVIITNGNYYAVFDRRKGLSYDDNFIADFTLTQLTNKDLEAMESLKKGNLK